MTKKYKIGHRLIYTPLGKSCEVICNTLEPGGANAETALIVVMVEKMAHPVTIPVRVQDDFLQEIGPQKPGILERLFPTKVTFSALIFACVACTASAQLIDSTFSIFDPAIQANRQFRITETQPETPIVFSARLKSTEMQPTKVLGVFKTEQRAGFWLTVGGAAGMVGGALLQGRAAYLIQTHGHSGDWDNYELTRTSGLSLQVLGAASYGGGFIYRSKSWYKKRPWLWGSVEAVGWFIASKYISEAAYRGRSKE